MHHTRSSLLPLLLLLLSSSLLLASTPGVGAAAIPLPVETPQLSPSQCHLARTQCSSLQLIGHQLDNDVDPQLLELRTQYEHNLERLKVYMSRIIDLLKHEPHARPLITLCAEMGDPLTDEALFGIHATTTTKDTATTATTTTKKTEAATTEGATTPSATPAPTAAAATTMKMTESPATEAPTTTSATSTPTTAIPTTDAPTTATTTAPTTATATPATTVLPTAEPTTVTEAPTTPATTPTKKMETETAQPSTAAAAATTKKADENSTPVTSSAAATETKKMDETPTPTTAAVTTTAEAPSPSPSPSTAKVVEEVTSFPTTQREDLSRSTVPQTSATSSSATTVVMTGSVTSTGRQNYTIVGDNFDHSFLQNHDSPTPRDVLVIDVSSDSVSAHDLAATKTALQTMLTLFPEEFGSGSGNNRLSLISYGTDSAGIVLFQDNQSVDRLRWQVGNMLRMGGKTCMAKAMEQALQHFKPQYGSRQDIPHATLLITDGKSDCEGAYHDDRDHDVIGAAQKLQQVSEVFVLGVGLSEDAAVRDELQRIVTDEEHRRIFSLPSFDDFQAMMTSLQDRRNRDVTLAP